MAKKVRIELDHDGFQTLLNSEPVKGLVKSGADRIAQAAGDGFEVVEKELNFGGSPRPGFIVHTGTWDARRAEAKDKVLSTALNAGR